MAMKDWKKFGIDDWSNKHENSSVYIVKEGTYYYVMVSKNGIERQYDNAMTNLTDVRKSAKQYMRTH